MPGSNPKAELPADVREKLKALLKCDDTQCQEGHYPYPGGEDGQDVDWGGCPNCVGFDGYRPRVNPEKLEKLLASELSTLRQQVREEIEKLSPEPREINNHATYNEGQIDLSEKILNLPSLLPKEEQT